MPSGSSFDQRSIIINDQQIVGQMFGGLDIIYTDRQLVLNTKKGARSGSSRTEWGTGRAASPRLWTGHGGDKENANNIIFFKLIITNNLKKQREL